MSELKKEVEELNRRCVIAQEKLKTAELTIKELGKELQEKYKLDPKLIKDSKKLREYLAKQNNSIKVAEEKVTAEVRALNDRITIT